MACGFTWSLASLRADEVETPAGALSLARLPDQGEALYELKILRVYGDKAVFGWLPKIEPHFGEKMEISDGVALAVHQHIEVVRELEVVVVFPFYDVLGSRRPFDP
eukprot:TRINITY_DN454_c0_g1_i8.p2 TRINITY_DN454_c0_g1~~TRINITY_DN454_c0_g1_i8.p2  ORF type:complete len:106 (+),score=13.18 TRINITY_DN454_c0_g1_i8:444-761(+)